MSLIHDAIRELESVPTSARQSPYSPASAATPGMSRPGPILGGAFVVLVLGAGGWWFSLPSQPKVPVISQQPAPLALALTSMSPPPVTLAPEGVVALRASPVDPDTAKPVSLLLETTRPSIALHNARPPPLVMPLLRPDKQIKQLLLPKKVAPPPETEVSLESRLPIFLQAMKADNLVAAGEQLAELQKQLPQGALTRLRAEAWFSLRSGNVATARQTYRAILERIPGDEEASLNLAFIEAQANRRELALQVLTEGLRGNPESEPVREALARFKMPVGN